MTTEGAPEALEAEADLACASGNLEEARRLLNQVVNLAPSASRWFKLASVLSAQGKLAPALGAVEHGLKYSPLDFIGLLSRASLLERLNAADYGEAYGRALAQRPTRVPDGLIPVLARAEAAYSDFQKRRKAELRQLVGDICGQTKNEEKLRIDRFISNLTRETKVFHSNPTHFHYPGLREFEFHCPEDHPWMRELELKFEDIRSEYLALSSQKYCEKAPYIRYAEHEPLLQWEYLNNNYNWTAIHLTQFGRLVEANSEQCPVTMDLLSRLPQPRIGGCSPNAVFSVLAPGTHIPPHTGVTNTRLLCHLPLIVPPGCWFRVGSETRAWEEGKPFVFDDTIEHEASNPTDQVRVVLIFDVWHPGLSVAEQKAVSSVLEAESTSASLAL